MKKILVITLGIVLLTLVLVALLGMYKFNYLSSRPGYDVDGNKIEEAEHNFEVIEVLGQSCQTNVDCETPMEYAVQSRCPYDSVCIKNTCTVVCPHPFSGSSIPK